MAQMRQSALDYALTYNQINECGGDRRGRDDRANDKHIGDAMGRVWP